MEGRTHISISKDQFQAALDKINIGVRDLEGLRLYAATAVIESPGGWLPSAGTSSLALENTLRGSLKMQMAPSDSLWSSPSSTAPDANTDPGPPIAVLSFPVSFYLTVSSHSPLGSPSDRPCTHVQMKQCTTSSWFPSLGSALYVSALCLAGGEMEEAELTSWRFVSSAFSLDLSRTKRHLVPGAHFLLQVPLGRAGLEGRGCGPNSLDDTSF